MARAAVARDGAGANDVKLRITDFAALDEMRDYMVRAPGEFCIERARLLTRFLKEKGGLDYAVPVTRQAEALKYILENKRANVFPGELLAGSTTSKRKGVLFYPEFLGVAIIPELFSMQVRKQNPYKFPLHEAMELNDEIFPFWADKTVSELVRKKLGDDDIALRLHGLLFMFMVSKFNCQSHTIPAYAIVLEKGIEGIVAEARKVMKSAGEGKRGFYQALVTACEGVLSYASHLAEECARQAATCSDPARKAQLEKMAEINRKVPAKPPETFWEAVQSIWTCMNALYQEQNNVGFSIGRIDQLLNTYLVSDLEAGRISRKEALEILSHFWLKVGDNLPLMPENGDRLFGGTGSNQAITIGGCDKQGRNAINEATYLCLDVVELVKVRDPNLNARVREDDPPAYTQRLAEVNISTGATPSLVSDNVTIPALQKTGVTLEDARDYAQVGCLEPNSAGRTFGHTGAILINVLAALEIASGNGDSRHHLDVGIRSGDPATFTTYEQFLGAVKAQLKHIIVQSTRVNNAAGLVYQYLHPQPLLSALFEGPMETGKELTSGGATYNSSGIAFIGMADLIDSLYTAKKLVYEEKRYTFTQLLKIVNSDFRESKSLLQYVINKLDHFGNGKAEVDAIGRDLVDFIYDTTRGIENYRGGRYNPGYWSMTIHAGFGVLMDALPHGRLGSTPLASGLTPTSFGQKSGPTGTFNSLVALDATKMPNGMALNMKFNRSLFKSQEKVDVFKSLFKAYFKQGGMQVQFTIHDAQTLIDARAHPDRYPDLMVRISGYTAYFNELNDAMKNEIIQRALMDI